MNMKREPVVRHVGSVASPSTGEGNTCHAFNSGSRRRCCRGNFGRLRVVSVFHLFVKPGVGAVSPWIREVRGRPFVFTSILCVTVCHVLLCRGVRRSAMARDRYGGHEQVSCLAPVAPKKGYPQLSNDMRVLQFFSDQGSGHVRHVKVAKEKVSELVGSADTAEAKKLHVDPESHHREKLFGDERQIDRSQESRNAQWLERRDTEAEPQRRP